MAAFHLIPNTSNCIDINGKYATYCLPAKEDCTPTSLDGILSNCGETWNCNLCPTDVEYMIPVVRGDKIMIQTQIVDRYNDDPKNPTTGFGDWLHVEVMMRFGYGENTYGYLPVSSRRFVGHDGRKSYQIIELDTSYTLFRQAYCFQLKFIVGDKFVYNDVAVINTKRSALNGSWTQITLDEDIAHLFVVGQEYTIVEGDIAYVCKVRDNSQFPNQIDVSGIDFALSYTEILLNLTYYENVTEEICTEEFGFVNDCDVDKTLTIRGDFERYDCFGNYYGKPVGWHGTGSFKYDNTIRYWADMRNTSGNLNKETFAAKTRRVVTENIWTFTLAETPIPPFAHRMLMDMYLAAPTTYIGGKPYQVTTFSVRNKIDHNNMLLYNADLFTRCEIQAYKC